MNDFFEKTKKMPHGHLLELAALCAGVSLLLFAAVFINGGFGAKAGPLSALISPASQTASIFPCGWFGDCPSSFVYAQSFVPNASVVVLGQTYMTNGSVAAPGQSVTLYWSIFGERYANYCIDGFYPCTITPDAPRSPTCTPSGHRGGGSGCTGNISGISGTYTVAPTRTTTYYLCSDVLNKAGVGCAVSTIYVPTATPTTLTSLTATPSSVASGSGTVLSWVGAKGTNFSACELTGGQWGSGAWFTALPGSISTNPLSANTTYSMDCFDTTGASTGWHSAAVTVPLGPCNDIPLQATVPNGCVTPNPAPGICIPTGGSYSPATNTCSCPAGQHLSGTACVANPLCSNGLNNSYAPSCTCSAGQYQPLGASSCAALPVCANGLSQTYSPSCTCPAGQVQSGSSCTPQGSIVSFTANPSRVLKGNTASISWSTSNMSACALTSLVATGSSNLSSLLSSAITPTIDSKTVFTLTCTDASGASYSASATVNLIPQTIEQ